MVQSSSDDHCDILSADFQSIAYALHLCYYARCSRLLNSLLTVGVQISKFPLQTGA